MRAFRKMPAAAITVAIVGLFLTITITGVLGAPKRATVSAINVSVYSDPKCKVNCSGIDWGNISPGEVITKTVYVKNTGDSRVSLSMTASSWTPIEAESLFKLSWNLGKRSLGAGKAVPATLTLSAAQNLGSLSTFKFTIIIVGTQKTN